MNAQSEPLLPRWEWRFPGRMEFERQQLAPEATNLVEEVRPDGIWVLTFDWMLEGRVVRLDATFPDTYSCQRPHVRLLEGWEPRPTRHLSPQDGNICLLGRASNQWHPGMNLAQLLREQLFDALSDSGDQDPQGEPADYWWSQVGIPGSYCLVDSDWTFGDAESGTLDLLVAFQCPTGEPAKGVFRSVVKEVRAANGAVLASWQGPLPEALRSGYERLIVPWARVDHTILPEPNHNVQLRALHDRYELDSKPQRLGHGLRAQAFIILHLIEDGPNDKGIGWIASIRFGQAKAFQPRDRHRPNKHQVLSGVLPVMRAGVIDLGIRVPAVGLLRQKRVAVFGLGAIGAPLAIELARNSVSKLHLIEHDVVEPGNTVRWPLGASSWGERKVQAIAEFVAKEYPATEAVPHQQVIGAVNAVPDGELIASILDDVDLVIDGTAAWGVSQFLEGECRRQGVPFIQFFATPTLGGGAVVRFAGSGGCPVCLEYAWHAEEGDARKIERPPGALQDGLLAQPVGCAERTFLGASYDLTELSLQAVRLAIDTLEVSSADSLVQTLSLADAHGTRILPRWREDRLPRHPACSCGDQPA